MSNSWPDIFPDANMQSYSIVPNENIIRTHMESGMKQRQRFTSRLFNVKIKWIMSSWIFSIFESWHRYIIEGGSEWFKMSLRNGLGSHNCNVRFISSYNSKLLSNNFWEISSNLEVKGMIEFSKEKVKIAIEKKQKKMPENYTTDNFI